MNENNKKILEKQLELLSERSKADNLTGSELAELSYAMCKIYSLVSSSSIFEIPQCVVERVEELKQLVNDNPIYIPIPEAAKFLRTSPESLRATLEQNPVFGLAWKKDHKSNQGFKIPTPTFYFWFMNMAGVQRFYEQYL